MKQNEEGPGGKHKFKHKFKQPGRKRKERKMEKNGERWRIFFIRVCVCVGV